MELIPINLSDASKVTSLMDGYGVEWKAIDYHNWSADYPYKPQARFRAAHSDHQIFIQFASKVPDFHRIDSFAQCTFG